METWILICYFPGRGQEKGISACAVPMINGILKLIIPPLPSFFCVQTDWDASIAAALVVLQRRTELGRAARWGALHSAPGSWDHAASFDTNLYCLQNQQN